MTEQRTARRIPVLGIMAFVLLAALLLTLAVMSAIKGVRTAESYGNVVRVEDGQTVVVNMDGTEEIVTLAGVVAPRPVAEGQDPTVDNCLADEALDNLSGILEPGAAVQLEYPEQSDGPRGTKLALVRHGGEVVNIVQTEAGLAVPLPEQPQEELGTELREAQETARSEETGLYSPGAQCTLAGRIAPAMAALQDLPEEGPGTSDEAEAQIEAVAAAVEQGVTAEKVFDTVAPESTSLSSLAWAADAPRLRERLDGALSAAQSELNALTSTRNVLQTREREAERRAEAERQRLAELERQRQAEVERQQQEAERQRQAEAERQQQEAERQQQEDERESADERRQAEAEQKKAEEEKKKAEEERKKAEEKKKAEEERKKAEEESSSPSP